MNKVTQKPSAVNQIETILSSLDHDSLKKFIVEQCEHDEKFRTYFLVNFGHINQELDAAFYRKQLKEIVKTSSDKQGFINWNNTKNFVKNLEPFVKKLESQLLSGNYQQSFFLSSMLLEEMIIAFKNADDSNGYIGNLIDFSVETLFTIASSDCLSFTLKKEIFEYSIVIFSKNLLAGWDWHLRIVEVAEKLIENEKEADLLISYLDKISDYDRKSAQIIILRLLHHYKSPNEVSQFIENNISNSRIRKIEIDKALDKNDFEYAKKLCFDGIEKDNQDKPGLAIEWYRFLLKIAQTENDICEIINQATYLFVNDSRSAEDYFEIMREKTPAERWNSDLEKLIIQIQLDYKNTWKSRGLIRKIYIKQEWWSRLMELLKQTESLENIETEELYLSKDFAPELIQMYSNRLKKYVEKFIGRDHYQKACQYLGRMKKLGGQTEVDNLIEHFRKTYPMRRALMDELNNL